MSRMREDRGKYQVGTGLLGNRSGAGNSETAFGAMDGVIGDPDLFGTGFLAQFDDGLQDLRMSGGCQLGRPCPGNVGFDDNDIPFGYESLHPAGRIEGFANQLLDGVPGCADPWRRR